MKKIITIIFVTIIIFSIVLIKNINLYIEENVDYQNISTHEKQYFTFADDGDVYWWSMYRHDERHTGYSTSSAPETNNLLWSTSTGNEVKASPAIYDNKVYVGSYDYKLYCLNGRNGSVIWDFTAGTAGLSSSPAVADGKVYIGSFPNVYCLNAINGSKIWEYSTGGTVGSSPAVYNDKVFIASSNQRTVYCLNAENGSEIWTRYTGQWTQSSPAVYNEKVYIGGGSKIFCLNAENGSEIWNHSLGGAVLSSSPALYNNKVYIGTNDNNVYCLNAENGSGIWIFNTEDDVQTSPAVANGKIYIGSNDNNVYCLNAENGSKIWTYETGGYIQSSPAVADEKLYIGSSDKNLYCLNAEDGTKIWNYQTDGVIYSSPGIADEKVYVGSNDNKVYCFGDEPPEIPDQPSGPTIGYTNIEYTYTTSIPIQPYLDAGWDWNGDNVIDEWTDIPASHIWTEEGIYDIRVKIRYTDGGESDWSPALSVTIINQSLSELQLVIDAQSSVVEGTDFQVLVTSGTIPIENVKVEFLEEISYTDDDGSVNFTAPSVNSNIDYIITANRTGYQDGIAWITVLNKEEHEVDKGWIFGIVSNISGFLVKDASVCAIRQSADTICTFTDEKGRFHILVPADTYTVKASKQGYETSTKYNIAIEPNHAVEVNFVLTEGSEEMEAEPELIYYAIQYGIDKGIIKSQVTVSKEEFQSTVYDERIEIEQNVEKDRISFKISGPDGVAGTVVALRIDDPEEILNTDKLNLNDIAVEFDNELIVMAGNFGDIFYPSDDSEAKWAGLITEKSFYILVFFPHFSEYTITVYSLTVINMVMITIFYCSLCIIAAVVFLSRFYLRPVYLTFFRKKKQ